MSKGTVIYIGSFELPDKNAAAHRVLSNAKVLRDIGYDVVFISVDKESKYNYSVNKTKYIIQGFDTWFVPYPSSNIQWIHFLSNIDTFLEVCNYYSNIKAVLCYNYQAVAFLKIKQYCRKHSIKIIGDCTEWYSVKGNNFIFKIIKGLDSFLRMRIIQKRLDGLIVISDYLEAYYQVCDNVVKVPPLVDLSESKWLQSTLFQQDDRIHLVYAGNPGKYKDRINLVIEALYQLIGINNYVFYVVGITKEQFMDYYDGFANKLEALKDRVLFLGRLSHVESLKYIQTADYCIFMRDDTRVTRAGFPTKFVESISCGTVVVTSNSSGLSEYIHDKKNGLLLEMSKYGISTRELKILLQNTENSKTPICVEKELFYYVKYTEQIERWLSKIIA